MLGQLRRRPNAFNLVHQLRIMQKIKPGSEVDAEAPFQLLRQFTL